MGSSAGEAKEEFLRIMGQDSDSEEALKNAFQVLNKAQTVHGQLHADLFCSFMKNRGVELTLGEVEETVRQVTSILTEDIGNINYEQFTKIIRILKNPSVISGFSPWKLSSQFSMFQRISSYQASRYPGSSFRIFWGSPKEDSESLLISASDSFTVVPGSSFRLFCGSPKEDTESLLISATDSFTTSSTSLEFSCKINYIYHRS